MHLSEEWYRVYGFDPNEGIPDWNKPVQRMPRMIVPGGNKCSTEQ
ncbi:MAG: hypothetical protein WBV41_01385 [Terriglobales bacterium]